MDLRTAFAPAEYSSTSTLQEQYRLLTGLPQWRAIFDAFSGPLMILNPQRQVVIANTALLHMLGGAAFSEVIGRRPGELLHCEVSERTMLGCGTATECRNCLLLQTIQTSVDVDWERQRVTLAPLSNHPRVVTFTATTLVTPTDRFTALHLS
jgi:PAS domain-containing protein